MSIFDIFRSNHKKSILQMIQFADKWSDIYLQKYAIKKNADVKKCCLNILFLGGMGLLYE